MKTLYTILRTAVFSSAICHLTSHMASAQCSPMIKIDGNQVIADENHPGGLKLPAWLRTGQTLEKGQYVFSISVIEFTVNGTSLDYSQNLSITTPAQTVPANKVWKIEAVVKDASMSAGVTSVYATAGTYTYVPSCTGTYKVKVWGAGGGGGEGCNSWCNGNGGGGGAGGYAEGDYFLIAGNSYVVTVGTGGTGATSNCTNNGTAGGSSSVGTIGISATGGAAGTYGGPGSGGSGGVGAGGQLNVTGQSGFNGSSSNGISGKGGDAPNGGGLGGNGTSNGGAGSSGNAPGGGGGGGAYYNTGCGAVGGATGGNGAAGKVEISSGSISSVTLTPKVPCVVLYQYSSSACSSTTPAPCPGGWTDAGCGAIFYGGAWTYCRTCYRCD